MDITNWDKWQTFRKDRGTPPWIKVYRNLLSNEQWVSLSDTEKGHLVSIWILAADKNGTIPDEPKMIQRMAMLDSKPNINKFIELGFLATTCQPDGNHELNLCPQVDAPEKSREEESRVDKSKEIDFSNLKMSAREIAEIKLIRKKNKGGKFSQRIINGLAKEFELARTDHNMTNDDILTKWDSRGWKSFESKWCGNNSFKQQKKSTIEPINQNYREGKF